MNVSGERVTEGGVVGWFFLRIWLKEFVCSLSQAVHRLLERESSFVSGVANFDNRREFHGDHAGIGRAVAVTRGAS
jgi:hypothetical protein